MLLLFHPLRAPSSSLWAQNSVVGRRVFQAVKNKERVESAGGARSEGEDVSVTSAHVLQMNSPGYTQPQRRLEI